MDFDKDPIPTMVDIYSMGFDCFNFHLHPHSTEQVSDSQSNLLKRDRFFAMIRYAPFISVRMTGTR